jgi:hypothetical protein
LKYKKKPFTSSPRAMGSLPIHSYEQRKLFH